HLIWTLSLHDGLPISEELNDILDHIEALGDLDVDGVPAMGLAAEWEAPLREDGGAPDELTFPLERLGPAMVSGFFTVARLSALRSEEHTSELQSRENI